jgi:hypothetical protein
MVPYFNATPFRYYFPDDGAVVSFNRTPKTIVRTLVPRLARNHPGTSLWAVIDTFDLKEDPAQRLLGATVPRYLDRNYVKTGSCALGRLQLVRYELPASPVRGKTPERVVAPWASCNVDGKNLALFASQVTISRNLAWFLAIVNILCIFGAAAAFWHSRRSSKRGPLLPRRRMLSRGGLEPEVEVTPRGGGAPPVASRASPNGPDAAVRRPAPARPAAPAAHAPAQVAPVPHTAAGNGPDEVVAKLSDPDPFLRISAIGQLKGRPDCDQLLVRALRDEYPLVRREAVRALREIGSSQATEALIEVAGHDPSAEVREEAVAALGQLVRERHGGRF